MNQLLKRVFGALVAIFMVFSISACSGDDTKTEETKAPDTPTASEPQKDDGDKDGDKEADKEGEEEEGDGEAGFREEPIGDDFFEGPIKVSAVYFQPVTMEPEMGVPAAEASMHLEADIAAVPDNKLGYGAGDFIPGLTVEYKVLKKDGTEAQSGTFMPMNASDGPHYGLNLPKLDAGDYKLQFIIKSPETNGWMLHTDKETGVEGKFWTEPIVAEFDNWHWDPATVWW